MAGKIYQMMSPLEKCGKGVTSAYIESMCDVMNQLVEQKLDQYFPLHFLHSGRFEENKMKQSN